MKKDKKKKRQYSDSELIAIVKARKSSSLGTDADGGNTLSIRRENLLKEYNGEPYGDERTGQSKIVTRQMMEAVEWALPSLMRIFASTDKIGEFKPENFEDEEAAKQETDAVNHCYNVENEGFPNTYTFVKSILMNPVGYMKIYFEDEEVISHETIEGLLPPDIKRMLQDEELEAVEADSEMAKVNLGGFIEEVEVFTVKFKRTHTSGRLRIEPVPPEELAVSGSLNKVTLEGCDYLCHTTYPTRSDLLERGYDKKVVEQLPTAPTGEKQKDEAAQRHHDTSGSDGDGDTATDRSTEKVEVDEHYLFIDFDGDGFSEYRMITTAGGYVLENDEVDGHPFIAGCAMPIPHVHVGKAWMELVQDLQKIYTTLMRQYLNNLYRVNNPRPITGRGVNLNDVINDIPGSPIRTRDVSQIRHEQTPGVGQHVLPAFEVLNSMKETRTGVSKGTMGLDADALSRVGNGAFYAALDQANQRLELLARIIAEYSFKAIFLKTHQTLRANQTDLIEFKAAGKWIASDPSVWKDRKKMKVMVGLGTGNKQAQAMGLDKIMEAQEKLASNPATAQMVGPQEIYNSVSKLVSLVEGMPSPEKYFKDPANAGPAPPKQPGGEEALAAAQMKLAEVEEKKADLRHQEEMAKLELKGQTDAAEYERKIAELQGDLLDKAEKLEQGARALDIKEFEVETSAEIDSAKVLQEGDKIEKINTQGAVSGPG